ncbi:MAG: TadE/TadG family type IV pilus assembly protein [Victivallaceae bacterium]
MSRPSHSSQRGQVMIMALIIMVILLLAIFFIFDVQTFVRAKIKLETASQASALTAANWQKNCLNLIGEINLIKASSILTSDIPTPGFSANLTPDERLRLKIQAACNSLTEMQSRISFIGPLIAYGAAQQAMKNNGVTRIPKYDDMMSDYLVSLNNDDRYRVGVSEYVNNYKWREAYIGMISKLKDEGTVLQPNGQFAGLEGINPHWMADLELWRAILNKNWCQSTLRTIIKFPDSAWTGPWWKVTYQQSQFPYESEIYTLGIDFSSDDRATFTDVAQRAANAGLPPLNISEDKLFDIRWCKYSSKWRPANSDGSWNYDSDAPDVSNGSPWHAGGYLRADLRPNVIHGGAFALAACSQQFKPMSKFKADAANPGTGYKTQTKNIQDSLKKYNSSHAILKEVDPDYVQMGGDAVAQPIGKLDSNGAPIESVVILPVFNDAILIPTTIRTPRKMPTPDDETIDYELFLTWLSKVDDLYNPGIPYPANARNFDQFLLAFQTLDKESFRKEGYNNDYTAVSADPMSYFSDSYKYSQINPGGAGWLQQVYAGAVAGPELFVPTTILVDSPGGNGDTKLWLGNRYIIRKADNSLYTNEIYICRGVYGSYRYPGGTRTAPTRL